MQVPSVDSIVGTGSDDGAAATPDGSAVAPAGRAGSPRRAARDRGRRHRRGANTGGGAGLANTGGTGGQDELRVAPAARTPGGAGGQTNTGGAGGGIVGGCGGTSRGGVGATSSGGVGGASGGGAGGQGLPPPFAYYPFDQTAGPDDPGHLRERSRPEPWPALPPSPAAVIGNGLSLPGTSGDYVALPSALLQSVTQNVTIAFGHGSTSAPTRPGSGSSTSARYSTNVLHVPDPPRRRDHHRALRDQHQRQRHRQRTAPRRDRRPAFGTWTHVAIVLGSRRRHPSTSTALSPAPTPLSRFGPADLGATTNNWLGRSQFTADPAFNGQIDDLRVYASALTAAQITTIYNAR